MDELLPGELPSRCEGSALRALPARRGTGLGAWRTGQDRTKNEAPPDTPLCTLAEEPQGREETAAGKSKPSLAPPQQQGHVAALRGA